jgi:hypothetical protein
MKTFANIAHMEVLSIENKTNPILLLLLLFRGLQVLFRYFLGKMKLFEVSGFLKFCSVRLPKL